MDAVTPKQTVSAGGVVVNAAGEILLVNQNEDSWSFPKGHLESSEEPLEAARREIYEESGLIDLAFIKSLGSYKRSRIGRGGKGEDKTALKTIHMFLFSTENDLPLRPRDPANPEARWVHPDEAAKLLTHTKDKAFSRSIKAAVKDLIFHR